MTMSGELEFKNNSNTLIVVLHEIYGINDHIKKTCKNYYEQGYDVICPDLLHRRVPFGYHQEKEAYLSFMNTIGFPAASEQVEELVRKKAMLYDKIILLGYSIGGTIAWLVSKNQRKPDGMICYYGSRIRDFMQINPSCPSLVFFPREEASFDTEELSRELNRKEGISARIFEGKHGFADPFSMKYNKASAEAAEQAATSFIQFL